MQYKVTCPYCGRDFQINASSRDTVQSHCPYCKMKMQIYLPAQLRQTDEPMHGSNVGSKIMQFVLTTLLILGVLAGGGFVAYGYLDFKTKTAEAKLQKNDRRRVRRDSLMQIRELQHKQEEADMKREVRQRVIIRFLTDFYLDAILGEGDQNSYKRFFSDRLRKEIEIIRDTCGAVGWKVFGPRRNAPDLQSLRKYLRVTHEDGDWYRVHLIQNGGTEFRYLKVHIGDRGIIMEDIR